jgi:hypothetical protein
MGDYGRLTAEDAEDAEFSERFGEGGVSVLAGNHVRRRRGVNPYG